MSRFIEWDGVYHNSEENNPYGPDYYETEDEYGCPVLRRRKRKYKRTAPIERRAWWAEMDEKAKLQCNLTAERLMAYRDHRAEFQIVDDTFQTEEPTLVQIGQYIGSHGTYVQKEEYRGQEKAYKHSRTIAEYLGKLEQIDLLSIMRFGLLRGWLSFRVPELSKQHPVEGGCCFDFSVISANPYFDDRLRVIVDVTIEADVFYLTQPDCPFCTVDYLGHTTKERYRVRVEFKMDGTLRLISIKRNDQIEDTDKTEKWWRLDQILMPVVSAEQSEDFAEMLYKALRVEAGRIDVIPSEFLFRLKGKKFVKYHRISNGSSRLAKIFFYDGTATCYDDNQSKETSVHFGDVWIDRAAIEQHAHGWRNVGKHSAVEVLSKKAYFHENVHGYTAWPYYRLATLTSQVNGSSVLNFTLCYDTAAHARNNMPPIVIDSMKLPAQFNSKFTGNKLFHGNLSGVKLADGIKTASSNGQGNQAPDYAPVAYLETLAERISPRVEMPRKLFTQKVQELVDAQKAAGYEKTNWGELIDQLAEAFVTTKDSVKYRLIELGFRDAIGARNWVEGNRYGNRISGAHGWYCQEYLATDELDGKHTYEISRADHLRAQKASGTYRQLLRDGAYAYVDGHMVVDSPKYITFRYNKAQLTDYALAHMDECCILFEKQNRSVVYSGGSQLHIARPGKLTSYTVEEQAEIKARQAESIAFQKELAQFKRTYETASLGCVLTELMKRKDSPGPSKLALMIGMSHHTVLGYMDDAALPDGFTLLKIIIALQLPAGYRRFLFSKLHIDTDRVWPYCKELELVDAILDTNEYRSSIESWDELIEQVYPEYYQLGFILDNKLRAATLAEIQKKGRISQGIAMLNR